MEENKFIVDLTGIKLSPAQRTKLSDAIQKAALRELANIDSKGNQFGILQGKIGRLPFKFPDITWYGIIIRQIRENILDIKNP